MQVVNITTECFRFSVVVSVQHTVWQTVKDGGWRRDRDKLNSHLIYQVVTLMHMVWSWNEQLLCIQSERERLFYGQHENPSDVSLLGQ